MKSLQFDCITLQNFRSFLLPQTFVFGEEGRWGLYFLRGKNQLEPRLGANGAGKSTVLMALCWVLYGRTPDNLRGPDIKPWKGKGVPEVSLVVYVNDEKHEITRKAKTNGLSIDGVEAGPEAAADLIGLSFETFVNTVLFPQGQPLFFDLAPGAKMDLFADALRLERWEEYSAAAGKKTRELEDTQAELVGEQSATAAALESNQELLKRAKERAAEWDTERATQLKRLEADWRKKEKRLKAVVRLVDDADLAHDSAATMMKGMRPALEQAREVVASAREEWGAATHAVRAAKANLKKFDEGGSCPVCQRPFEGHNPSHRKTLEKELKSAEAALLRAQSSVDAAAAKQETLQDQYEVFSARAQTALAELNLQRPEKSRLEGELAMLRTLKESEERNPHTEHVSSLRRKVSQQEVALTEIADDIRKVGRQIERHRFWVKGFKDVKLYLIEEVLQELQLASNLMLAEFGLEGWEIHYAVEKEAKSGNVKRGINITIKPAYGSGEKATSVKWESWSGGESQRLRIIGALALSEVLLNYAGVSTDLEALDDPTRHLSRSGAEDLCEFLRGRATRLKRNIWLVDHLAHETSQFAGGTLVTKTAKGSVLESW